MSRYLREAALQPHKSRYWLNTTERIPQPYKAQVKSVCDTYRAAPALERTEHTHTVCVDEMTGLQAMERNAPTLPMIAGKRPADRVRVHAERDLVPDRQLRGDDRGVAPADDRPDADGEPTSPVTSSRRWPPTRRGTVGVFYASL